MNDYDAARHLLSASRLRVDLDDFWSDELGTPDFARLREAVAYSSTENMLVDLAEAFCTGALGDIHYFDAVNWQALQEAIHLSRHGRLPEA